MTRHDNNASLNPSSGILDSLSSYSHTSLFIHRTLGLENVRSLIVSTATRLEFQLTADFISLDSTPLQSQAFFVMPIPDKHVRAVKSAMRKAGPLGSSHADDVLFISQDLRDTSASQKIYIGVKEAMPVYCHLQLEREKPYVQLWRENAEGDLLESITMAQGMNIELVEPFLCIAQRYPGTNAGRQTLGIFFKACFIVKGFLTCSSIADICNFTSYVKRAVATIEVQENGPPRTRNMVAKNIASPPDV